MATAAITKLYTPEEYLALERKAEFKSEYYGGLITPRPREGARHNIVDGNFACEVMDQLEDRPCEVYMINMHVRVSPTGLYTYPDVVAVCVEPMFLDDRDDTLVNPTLIAEVLSPATEAYDRGEKFARYRQSRSLIEYVVVAQDRVFVERYERRGEDWLRTEFRDINETLTLESMGCRLPLREIYHKVKFPGLSHHE